MSDLASTSEKDGGLLPCPFCGGPAAVFKTTGSGLPVQLDPQKYIVGCEQLACCEGGRPQRTEEAAISFWNERAHPPAESAGSPSTSGVGDAWADLWEAERIAGDLLTRNRQDGETIRRLIDRLATQQPRGDGVRVDDLAQIIRRVDGENKLGAGALAEAVVAALSASRDTQPALLSTNETQADEVGK